jgi:hypothetical protein
MKMPSIYMFYALCIANVSAVVPTTDVKQEIDDITAMKSYTAHIASIVYNIGQAVDIAEQIRNLKSLEDVERAGGAICKLCSSTERFQLQQYINQVNDDLCSQFGTAMQSVIGAEKTVKSIQNIIDSFSTNPKEAGLALQAAATQANSAIQGSLSQIQVLLVQKAQKQLAQEKLSKQNNQALYIGIKQSGL